MLETASVEKVLEQLLILGIVRCLFELELPAVSHVLSELFGVSVAQLLNGRINLALLDLPILVVLVFRAQALPWEFSFEQIEDHVTGSFEVVSATLLDAKMGVGGGIASRSRQALLVAELNVLIGCRVLPVLGKTEINEVDGLRILFHTDENVFRLQVAMNVGHLVEGLDSADELLGYDQDRLQRELPAAIHEQILKRRAEELDRHYEIVSFSPEPHKLRKTDYIGDTVLVTFSNEVLE